ncbi:hypothetical protein KI387_038056, partial [Taxus chinensis]
VWRQVKATVVLGGYLAACNREFDCDCNNLSILLNFTRNTRSLLAHTVWIVLVALGCTGNGEKDVKDWYGWWQSCWLSIEAAMKCSSEKGCQRYSTKEMETLHGWQGFVLKHFSEEGCQLSSTEEMETFHYWQAIAETWRGSDYDQEETDLD